MIRRYSPAVLVALAAMASATTLENLPSLLKDDPLGSRKPSGNPHPKGHKKGKKAKKAERKARQRARAGSK